MYERLLIIPERKLTRYIFLKSWEFLNNLSKTLEESGEEISTDEKEAEEAGEAVGIAGTVEARAESEMAIMVEKGLGERAGVDADATTGVGREGMAEKDD